MSANVKTFRFVVRKEFECMNKFDTDIVRLPEGYVFKAWVKTYQMKGKEVQNFHVFPDGKLIRRRMEIRGVCCSHTKFAEDE